MYKALSGAIAQMHRLEVSAQDLANVNTSGYKGQRLTFGEVLANRLPGTDRPGGLVAVADQKTNFFSGDLLATGNPFHLAIDGDGFFVVRTPRGERYTRNGNFTLKSDGAIVTSQGDPVLGESGPLLVTGSKIEVAPDGSVTSNEGDVGKFKIVRFADSRQATKEGANLFISPLTNVKQTEEPRVIQGQLEQSNVSPIDNMVSLIVIQRQFEAYQRAMSLMDSVTQKMIAEGAN